MRVAIAGAGGHGKVVADALLAAGQHQLVGFFDEDPGLWGTTVLAHRVLGAIEGWSSAGIEGIVIAIGDNRHRGRLFRDLEGKGAAFPSIIHPSAVIGAGVAMGKGAVVLAQAVVNVDSAIGDNVILNTACSVDHDCVLGANVHIAPAAHLAGQVRVGIGAFVGVAAAVLPGVTVGPWATVGAGAVVTSDVGEGMTVVGVPARETRK